MSARPTVVVSVEGGIANTTTYGDVDVILIDWDVISSTDSLEELLAYREEAERLPDPTDREGALHNIDRAIDYLKEG